MRRTLVRAAKALCAGLLAVAGLACSSGGGDVAFVATFQASDVRVDTDLAGAASSVAVRVSSEGLNVYAVWSDSRNGATDVYFNRSTDGGQTWSVADTRLDSGTAGAAASDDPQICVSGQNIWVVWEDRRDGARDVYMNRSTDGGLTWTGDQRLDTDVAGAAESGDPQIDKSGSNVFVIWEEERNGLRDVYFRRSTDGGATWDPESVLNTNGLGTSFSDRPRISASGSYVYVVWHDSRNGNNDVFLNASSNSGATFFAADVRLDTDVAGSASSTDPEIDANGANVFVAWSDARSGALDIHMNLSTDGGATFMAADTRVDTDAAGSAISFRPQVRCSGSSVYVAWIDTRDGANDARFNRSSDSGATWGAADVRLNTDGAGASTADFIQIAADGINVYAVWQDNRDGANDIRFVASTDRGATFDAQDMQCDTHTPGLADSVFPRITVSGTNVYVLWSDVRDGNNDVYCRSSTQ